MDASQIIRHLRRDRHLTLRELGEAAGTSHATLSAYEHGHKAPRTDTLTRTARAAGYELAVTLVPTVGGPDPAARGRELVEVLELAAEFPARHRRHLTAPRFGRAT